MNRFWTAASFALALGMSSAAALGASPAPGLAASSGAVLGSSSGAAQNARSGAAQDPGSGAAPDASPALPQDAPSTFGHADSPGRDSEDGAVLAPFDATMILIGEAANLPAAVTKSIELPKNDSGAYLASPRAVTRAADGLATASRARDNGNAFGKATADAVRVESRGAADVAREAGRAFAEAAAAAAQRNREELGHGSPPRLGGLPGERGIPVVPVHAALPIASARP